MKKLISLEIGPNYQLKDGLIAFASLVTNKQDSTKEVSHWFLNKFGANKVWFYNTCRSGIYSVLKSLNLKNTDEVLVQGFSCIVVPNAVIQAELKPVICDVNKDNFNFDLTKVESKINKNTKVWIIQYNFGIFPDMAKVKEIVEKHNLILIEDCAHSLGGKFEIRGEKHLAGAFGHFGVFSFGRDKIISTTTGGAVIANSITHINTNHDLPQYIKALDKTYNNLQPMESKYVFQNLLYAFATPTLIKPFYYFGFGKVIAYILSRFKITGSVYTSEEKKLNVTKFSSPQKYSEKLFPLLLNQIRKLDKYNNHRKTIAAFYAKELKLEFEPMGSVYMRFPVFIQSLTKSEDIKLNQSAYNQIISQCKNQGIFLGKWYTRAFLGAVVDDQKIYNYELKNLTNVSTLIDNQVLNLPTNISTSLIDAKKIVEIIKNNLV